MSQALPPNLINISIADLNRAFDQGVDFTSPQALNRYWKFYAASSAYVDDPISIRSRNLFWRLLRSPGWAGEITEIQLATLWQRCQRDEPLQPFQLPKRFRQSEVQTLSASGSSTFQSVILENKAEREHVDDQLLRAESDPSSRASKRRSRGSFDRGDPCSKPMGYGLGEITRPGLRRNMSGKGRAPTVASSSRGRAKPTLSRRKSSQSRSQPSTAQVSPRPALRSPQLPAAGPSPATQQGSKEIPTRSNQAVFELPSASSWQSVDESLEQPLVGESGAQAARGSLVDPDFRRNFADHRQLMSGTNLAALGRGRKTGSIVRFEDVPEVIGKGKDRASSPTDDGHEERPKHSRSGSQVISDSDDSEGVSMPRVQSNLSKLIKKERQESAGWELPPAQGQKAGQSASSKKKDEEILEMGRKAGAPVIPKGRPGSDVAERFRSPSPGATF